MDSVEQAREVLSAAEQVLGTHAILPGFGDDDLDSAAVALSAVRHTLSACLAAEAGEKDPARARQIAAVLMRSEHAQATILDAILARRASQVLSARDAVGRLREAWSTKGLIDRAAAEAHRIGFDRILFSRLDHGLWLTSSAYAGADEQFAHTLVEAGQAHPRKLIGTLEGEMVRRGAPIVVRDPQLNPHVYTELVTLTETQAYVAAPVLAWGQPIGLIHADRQAQSVLVDESDRDVLSVFAEGLGIAFERNLLLDRLRTVRQACNDYARGVNALADDVTIGVVEGASLGEGLESSMPAAPGSTQPPAGVRDNDGGVSEPLTRREWDVLHGLATGKTNAQIAVSLFVAEGTVKTHVKHVLRKLGAANRTEAVAKYHRMIN